MSDPDEIFMRSRYRAPRCACVTEAACCHVLITAVILSHMFENVQNGNGFEMPANSLCPYLALY